MSGLKLPKEAVPWFVMSEAGLPTVVNAGEVDITRSPTNVRDR